MIDSKNNKPNGCLIQDIYLAAHISYILQAPRLRNDIA